MAKLTFYYGVMGCSKTANALITRFQYSEAGKHVWLIKPKVDTRDDLIHSNGTVTTLVKSRVGISAEAEAIDQDINIESLFKERYEHGHIYDIIICDEAQFLTELQIEQLKNITIGINPASVVCYGLRTDFKSKLFAGSKRLFELADELKELKSVCDCGEIATVNARLDKAGHVLIAGSQVEIGGNERYRAMCWKCWNNKINKLNN